MRFAVKEIFYTLQGEGAKAGQAAVFCRFAGCNLWTGHEPDRAAALCDFCDTDFVGTDGVGGGTFASAEALADAVDSHWPGHSPDCKFVVCTGGEPLLQMNDDLVAAFHKRGFQVAIETNGTRPALRDLDWICVSPKAKADLVIIAGDELKLIYPQIGAEPERYENLDFKHFFLQPMDGPERECNTRLVIAYCLAHPRWRLSLQTQKILGIR